MNNLFMDDTDVLLIKDNFRHHLKTPIILVNNIEDYRHKDNSYYDPNLDRRIYRHSGLVFKKIHELDFWNEISGFFHQNAKNHKVYCIPECEVEIPSDIECKHWDGKIGSLSSPIVAGACIVDKDYNVYIIDGWYDEYGNLDNYAMSAQY